MNPLLFLLSACAAVVVLASPHHVARHNAIAARAALAIPQRRQSTQRRCRPRPSPSENPGNPHSTPTYNNLTTSTTPTPPVANTTPTPAPTTTQISNNNPGDRTGEGTFYSTGLGACGLTNTDNDFIVAISHQLFDSFPDNGNPNTNPVCRRMINAQYGGKTVSVMAVDRCEGCQPNDLDFSPAAFKQLASMELGRIRGMTWSFAN